MTVPFYSQAELDAAIAKERLLIRAEMLRIADAVQADLDAESPPERKGKIIDDGAYALRLVSDRIGRGDYARGLAVDPMPQLPPEARDGMPIGYFIADPLDPKLHHPCSPKGWWYVDPFLKNDDECIAEARAHAAIVHAGQTDHACDTCAVIELIQDVINEIRTEIDASEAEFKSAQDEGLFKHEQAEQMGDWQVYGERTMADFAVEQLEQLIAQLHRTKP